MRAGCGRRTQDAYPVHAVYVQVRGMVWIKFVQLYKLIYSLQLIRTLEVH